MYVSDRGGEENLPKDESSREVVEPILLLIQNWLPLTLFYSGQICLGRWRIEFKISDIETELSSKKGSAIFVLFL